MTQPFCSATRPCLRPIGRTVRSQASAYLCNISTTRPGRTQAAVSSCSGEREIRWRPARRVTGIGGGGAAGVWIRDRVISRSLLRHGLRRAATVCCPARPAAGPPMSPPAPGTARARDLRRPQELDEPGAGVVRRVEPISKCAGARGDWQRPSEKCRVSCAVPVHARRCCAEPSQSPVLWPSQASGRAYFGLVSCWTAAVRSLSSGPMIRTSRPSAPISATAGRRRMPNTRNACPSLSTAIATRGFKRAS